MPYWSIAEWRARIGSSWCALGRPLKIIKHGARILNKELTLYRILTLIILMVLLVGVNFGVRGLLEEGHHHQLMSLFQALSQNVFLLKSVLVIISVLKISIPLCPSCKTYRHRSNAGSFSFVACFFLYMILFILKIFNPAISPLHWFVPTVMVLCLLNRHKSRSAPCAFTSREEGVLDLTSDQNRKGSVKVDKRNLVLANSMLDTMLSVAASVIMSLLLLSGDIEENPGPGSQDLDYNTVDSSQILNKDDLADVREEVFSIKSAYYNLGISLRLEDCDLKRIREKCSSEEDGLTDILLLWLRKQYNVKRFGPPTWRMMAEAVNKESGGNDHELAKKIALKHASIQGSTFQARERTETHQHKLCQQLCCWRSSEADSDEHEGRERYRPLDNRQSSEQDVQVKETQLKTSAAEGATAAQLSQPHMKEKEADYELDATDTSLSPQAHERKSQPESDIGDDTDESSETQALITNDPETPRDSVNTDGAPATQPPQPSEKETRREDVPLTPHNTREILDVTWPHRARWRLIGTELGIDTGTLDAIDANNKKVESCLNELITGWLRNINPRPTRAAITAVLNSEHILSAAAQDSKSATADDKLGEYADYLTSLYKAKTQVCYQDKDHWPPPVTNKVFRLAMIKAEKVEKRKIDDDFVKSTITGKVDDILRKKVPVELENIFSGVEEGQQIKVLIEGAPGCGKSTLSQYICHQWAKGKLFQEYNHVILVRLRELIVQNAKSLADMLPRRDDPMGEEMAKMLSACDGQGSLFIFDGWDELPLNAAGRSIVTNILSSSKLHKCSVIITSRPIASMSLLNLVNSRIEILGFTKDELRQYFAGCLDNDKSKVVILQQRIQENPVVAGSCYLPLNASILVHLFKCENELPKTQFDIFSALICNCMYRHLKKTTTDVVPAIESLDELPQNIAAPFQRVCVIAYEGVMEEKIIFKLEDGFNTLGLLQGVESFAKYGMLSRSYNFLHLSIQELLAAVYMATQLSDEQQVEQFTKLFGRPRFSAVFRFYAAETKLKTPGIKDIVIQAVKKCTQNRKVMEFTSDTAHSRQKSSSFNFGHEPQPLLVTLLHCLYEAQDKKLCQLVATELKQKLNLNGINLDPADCLSVGYVLTYCKSFDVDLGNCNIGDDCYKTLFKHDGDYSGLLSLDLQRNSISTEGARAISTPMKTMTNLKILDLGENSITIEGAVALSEALMSISTLQKLYLYNNSFGDDGTKEISDVLKIMTNLQLLDLGGNSITNEGAVALSEALKSITTLQALDLGGNSITNEGAVALSEALKSITTLQQLYLYNNSIGDDGAKAISEAVKEMANLQTLNLDNNSIGDDGAKAISEAVKTMTNLQELDIDENFIGEAGLAALSAAKEQSGTTILTTPQKTK